jgi:hypothetical protein
MVSVGTILISLLFLPIRLDCSAPRLFEGVFVSLQMVPEMTPAGAILKHAGRANTVNAFRALGSSIHKGFTYLTPVSLILHHLPSLWISFVPSAV